MAQQTFYWHDYETWGANPRVDRASQFAGLRTDSELNVIGQPLVVYCQPADDMLPHPEACLITGITPQQARAEGVCEADFYHAIHDELSRPGTCGVGYNSLRFDDEVTRYGLYRNFYDPYGREWRNGNSRWDLIDVVRLTRALRPEGIEWPEHEPGVPSFRLEQLTEANGISHESAHDALSDVHATIALARLIRQRQPRLYEYCLGLRDKRKVLDMLAPGRWQMQLHVSRMIPASLGCISPVVPLAAHPTNRNSVIVYDLRHDPQALIELDADSLRQRLFTPQAELPEGQSRLALKEVHANKCPVLSPVSTLDAAAAERWQIDLGQAKRHLRALQTASELEAKVGEIYRQREFAPVNDPDQQLYDAFIDNADRRLCDQVLNMSPEQLAGSRFDFRDKRLPELLFRYRARNWPETLDEHERQRWQQFRVRRLNDCDKEIGLSLAAYRTTLAKLSIDPSLDQRQRRVVDQLLDWPAEIGADELEPVT